jgi:hypothetical protein
MFLKIDFRQKPGYRFFGKTPCSLQAEDLSPEALWNKMNINFFSSNISIFLAKNSIFCAAAPVLLGAPLPDADPPPK